MTDSPGAQVPGWLQATVFFAYVVVHLAVWKAAATHYDSAPFIVIELVAILVGAVPMLVVVLLWRSRTGDTDAH